MTAPGRYTARFFVIITDYQAVTVTGVAYLIVCGLQYGNFYVSIPSKQIFYISFRIRKNFS